MQNAVGRALTMMGLTLLLICTTAIGQARAQFTPDEHASGWTFDVMPLYLWFPEITGDLTVRGQSDRLAVSPLEWADLMLNDSRFAATGRVHARKDRFLFTLDLLAVSIEQNDPFFEVLRRNSAFTEIMVEFGVGYHIGTQRYPNGSAIAMDVVVGGRYQHIKADADIITQTLTLGFEQTVDWLEPLIGAMFTFDLTKKLGFFLGGNVGGFGLGSDLTWTFTSVLIVKNIWRNMSVFAGYRVMDIDYSEGGIHDKFVYDIQMRGPGFGVNLNY